MASPMRVLAPNILPGNVEHNEVPLGNERHLPWELAHRETAAEIGEHRQLMDGDAAHRRRFDF
jgi:hypothetical protein